MVLLTPKYHAEMAGEGIEYTWGVIKSIYWSKSIDQKSSREKFISLLQQIIKNIITTDKVRKFSKRSRNFMICYDITRTKKLMKFQKII